MPSIRSLLTRLLARGPDAGVPASKPERSAAAAIETDFRVLAESSNDVILRIGADMVPVYVSPSVEQVTGWTAAEMIAGGAGGFIHPGDAEIVAKIHERLVAGQDEESKPSFRLLRKDGTPLWVEANARLIRDTAGSTSGDVVIVMRDISDRKRLEDELRTLSLTDGLTGLCNRRAFDERLSRDWEDTARRGSQMSLLLLDIDHFKRFNDLYGHQAGDDCLRVVASAISRAVERPSDFVARYGGEEIAVILPETDALLAEAIAEKVRMGVEALAVHHAGNVNAARTVTVSIGVATAFSRAGGTIKMPEGLLLAADTALYKAKQNGRNRLATSVLMAAQDGLTQTA